MIFIQILVTLLIYLFFAVIGVAWVDTYRRYIVPFFVYELLILTSAIYVLVKL
jgi:hypothetical protein